jgi:signal transduction histidine kinase
MRQPRVAIDLKEGDHACILFRSDEEHRQVVGRFLAEGLLAGERVLNLVDQHTPEAMRACLREAGVEPGPAEASGQLTIRGAEGAYLPHGAFDPDDMILLLQQAWADAARQGRPAMRGSGDMGWCLRGAPGSDRVMEYEAKLNHAIPGSRFRALCQYDVRLFPPEMLLEVLTTHPIAFIGTRRFENFYYMSPDEYLGPDRAAAKLERWSRNLAERQELEARRQVQALHEQRVALLEEELAAKKAFMNAAAHELATPLTPLGLQIDYLRKLEPATPLGDCERNLAMVRRNFDRLRSLVDQLLDAVRAEGAHLRIEARPTDLHGLVRECLESYEGWAAEKGQALHLDGEPGALASLDPDRVAQVIDNLVSNAVKFTPPNGRIQVRLRPDRDGWRVAVTDSGPGLGPGQAERLFQPFSQVHDPMKVVEHGAGLGLFISKSIVERHGGRIWVSSDGPGAGCTFAFWLPRAPPAAAAEAEA